MPSALLNCHLEKIELIFLQEKNGTFGVHRETKFKGIIMRIKEKLSQNRRDFTAIYECEHCGETKEAGGYDDGYFHQNVIPKMKCKKCGKIADETYSPLQTRYPDDMQV